MMHPHFEMKQLRQKEGFTLVEIALALLVVAIGMVSIMGLFPAGLQANKRAIDETRVAMFAEDVLGGVKTVIEETPWDDVPAVLQSTGLPTVAPEMFVDDVIYADSTKHTNKYEYVGLRASLGVEFALRYDLQITPEPPAGDPLRPVNRYGITLQIWPNEYGQGQLDEKSGFVFYTEAYYHGRHN